MNSTDIAIEKRSEKSAEEPFSQPQVRNPERFTGHRISLQLFEGPLDLLLYLIRAHRYDVCDIPIREITTQFVDFLAVMDEVDIEYAGDFLVTAATLMQIKVRMLLPKEESINEEEMEDADEDPRQALVNRLLEYQRLQEAAETLKDLGEERALQFSRPHITIKESPAERVEDVSQLLRDVSAFDLVRALQRVMKRMKEKPVALVRRESFSLADRTRSVLARIGHAAKAGNLLTFDALCDDCQERVEVVITFLALLELIRRHRVTVSQKELFGEIHVNIVAKQ